MRLPISRMVIHTLVYYWETDFRCLQQILIESNPCQIEKESKFSCPSLSITSNESRLVEFIVADNQGNLVCFSISWERNADNDMKQLAEADRSTFKNSFTGIRSVSLTEVFSRIGQFLSCIDRRYHRHDTKCNDDGYSTPLSILPLFMMSNTACNYIRQPFSRGY